MESRGSGFFAEEHGVPMEKYDGRHWQDNVKLRDTRKIVGHAVRAVYLLAGATDYAAATGDEGVIRMLDHTAGLRRRGAGVGGDEVGESARSFDDECVDQSNACRRLVVPYRV